MTRTFLLAFLLTVPMLVAYGQLPNFYVCEGGDCQFCDLVTLGQRIINFCIMFGVLFATLSIAITGFKFVLSGGSAEAKGEAKKRMLNILTGFVIILLAYLIINTIMVVLTGKSLNGWSIECVAPPRSATANPSTGGTQNQQGGVTVGGAARQCTNCTAVTSLPLKDGACANQSANGCQVNSALATKLSTLDDKLEDEGINWQITEAYPPTVNHQNSCHSAGTCVDANCIGSCNDIQIKSFIESAESSGLRPIYEVRTRGEYDSLTAAGVPAKNLAVVPQITAEHFSVYSQ